MWNTTGCGKHGCGPPVRQSDWGIITGPGRPSGAILRQDVLLLIKDVLMFGRECPGGKGGRLASIVVEWLQTGRELVDSPRRPATHAHTLLPRRNALSATWLLQ